MSPKSESKSNIRSRRRGGRPPADMVGEVDTRLLDAAEQLFLARGYEATSCDQVAALAGAGKASLYARYNNKEELFSAVAARNIRKEPEWSDAATRGISIPRRLEVVGAEVIEHSLDIRSIKMMRMIIETANRLPDLARVFHQISRDNYVNRVLQVVAMDVPNAQNPSKRTRFAAERFVDLICVPLQMSALLGTSTEELRKAAFPRIQQAVDMLTNSGLLDDWLRVTTESTSDSRPVKHP